MDTAAVYERPGYEPIIGYDALLDFYRKTRRVRLGRHDVHRVLCQGEDVVSCGLFTGELKNGEPVTMDFSEIYRLNEQRTRFLFRKTYFSRRPSECPSLDVDGFLWMNLLPGTKNKATIDAFAARLGEETIWETTIYAHSKCLVSRSRIKKGSRCGCPSVV